jgi:hypothetical protein
MPTDVKHPDVTVVLTGTDSNPYSIIGKVRGALVQAGLQEEASKFQREAHKQESWDKVLQLAMKWVVVE